MTAPAVVVSPLADWSEGRVGPKRRDGVVYGIALHTTGSGVVDRAFQRASDPLVYAAQVYADPDNYCAHYAMGWDGIIANIMAEDLLAQHIGFSPDDRHAFLDGTWVSKVSQMTQAVWRARWTNIKSPAHLFPGPSPNQVFVGIEMVPLTSDSRCPAPRAPGLTFTQAQHDRVAALIADISTRWDFRSAIARPEAFPCPRLVGHEDVNPIQRSDAGGGWDPGALRASPRFDWPYVESLLATAA